VTALPCSPSSAPVASGLVEGVVDPLPGEELSRRGVDRAERAFSATSSGLRHVDEFLDRPVSLDFWFFQPDDVIERLKRAGFLVEEAAGRYPYPEVDYPSKRAYVLAHRPEP